MGGVGEFNKLLAQRIKELIPMQTHWAEVKSVDWDKRTMTAIGTVDQLEFYGVLLGMGAEARKPAIGSRCLIGTIQNQSAGAYLIWAHEIEEYELKDKTGFKVSLKNGEMTINGDGFGGLVNAQELKTQLDKNTAILNQIQQTFSSWVPVAEDGGAALKSLSGSFTGMPTADLSNIENPKIKHG